MSTKLIRRFLIASGLVIGATAAFSPTAFAQTSGTVPLAGTASSTLAITAAPTAQAAALPLDVAVEQIVKAADLAITTNNSTGYTLSVTSGNLAKAGTEATITPIAYQVTTVADAAVAVAGDFTVASGTEYTVPTAAAGAVPKDLYIRYTPAALQDAGAYGATIALTVSDNI